MFYELKLQCTSHSRAKAVLWEAQPAINKDKALPGMGLGRVIADSIISLSPPPSGPQITWALGHCPLDSAQRQREMAKQFISSETECKLGLVKRLGPESNDRALILEATEESDHKHPGVEPVLHLTWAFIGGRLCSNTLPLGENPHPHSQPSTTQRGLSITPDQIP